MTKGLWVWPSDSKAQGRVLRKIAASPHLVAALAALGKSKEGMSNAELDDAINDVSEWTTLWVVRQLTSLGLTEYKVDFFGNPARYQLTESGRAVLSTITGKPLPQKPAAPVQPPAPTTQQPPAPRPAAPAPQVVPQTAPAKVA
ncbi:MAG TPA: hypothetical protein VLY82_06630 [Nitrososphaerales archaeon]|nr:hypothetical protein [Nitrososphaerales archaeon]